MRLSVFALLASGILFGACQPEGPLRSPNGYRYEYRTNESGPTVQPGEVGKFHFVIMKGDSAMLDSRQQNPEPQAFVVPVDETKDNGPANIIIDALKLMSVGDSLSIYLAMDTIEQRPPGFGPEDELRYDVSLVAIQDTVSFQQETEARNAKQRALAEAYGSRGEAVADTIATELQAYNRGAAAAGYTTTASGLKYKVLQQGTGPVPPNGMPVVVSYYGVLVKNGEMFDNSFRAGRPFDFPLGNGAVITGWDEGIALLPQGSRAILAIPSDLGYGDNPRPGGPIGPGDELFFYVDVEKAISGNY